MVVNAEAVEAGLLVRAFGDQLEGDDPAHVARVAAVREVIGPDRRLMVDANQRWTLEQAERAIGELAAFDLAWIEEPLRADDLAGHVALRERVDVPVALGENLYTRYRFAEFIDAGAASIVQPNAVRVGGITPFLEIAALADERGVELAPHLLLELSAQLALVLPGRHLVESVEDGPRLAEGFDLDAYLMSIEADLLRKALDSSTGDRAMAARLLGISPRSLRYLLGKHRLA